MPVRPARSDGRSAAGGPRRKIELHRHQPLGARPRHDPRGRGPPERRSALATGPGGEACSRIHGRPPREPSDGRVVRGRRRNALRRAEAHEVRHLRRAARRRARDRSPARRHDRHRPRARGRWLPHGRPARVRGIDATRRRDDAIAHRSGMSDHRGEHRRRARRAATRRRRTPRSGSLGEDPGDASRAPRGRRRDRARRLPGQGVRGRAGRGGHGRRAGRRALRRGRRRVEPGPRAVPVRGARSTRWCAERPMPSRDGR